MEWYHILLITIGALLLLMFGITIFCYFMTFYNKKIKSKEEYYIPPGEIFSKHKDEFIICEAVALVLPNLHRMMANGRWQFF